MDPTTIPRQSGTFDMVFLDASKNEYLDYLRLVEGKLHKGSVAVADNAGIFAEEMSDYLDHVRNSGRYESKYLSFGEDGVEVSFLKSEDRGSESIDFRKYLGVCTIEVFGYLLRSWCKKHSGLFPRFVRRSRQNRIMHTSKYP